MLTITLDWLAGTFKEMTDESETWLRAHTPVETSTPDAPTNGYRASCRGPNGVVRMWNNDRPEMGTHVILSGSTLRSVVEHVTGTQAALLQSTLRAGISVTRLDLAVDCEGVGIHERLIYLQSQVGPVAGTARTFAYMESNNGGKTLYIGSRSSERFIRIYDKAAEQGLADIHWHRMEVETKGMVARSVAALLDTNDDWHAVFTGVCRAMADFPGSPDYAVFFEGVDCPIGVPKIEKKSDTEKWIEQQVIPAVLKHLSENRHSPAIARLAEALEFMRTYHTVDTQGRN